MVRLTEKLLKVMSRKFALSMTCFPLIEVIFNCFFYDQESQLLAASSGDGSLKIILYVK